MRSSPCLLRTRWPAWAAAAAFLLLATGAAARDVDVFSVMAEFDRVAAAPLWPNFHPLKIPLALYDGRLTWLFRHPHPPPEFHEAPGHAGVWLYEGRYPAVDANSDIELNSVRTAAALLSQAGNASPRQLAALVVHEAFHVFERQSHPTWSANEGELFVYPLDNAEALKLRRLETEALRRALLASPSAPLTRCWTAAALQARQARFALLPEGSVEYERVSELNEGLAQYVEAKARDVGRSGNDFRKRRETYALLPEGGFPAAEVRQRTYATGQALATLLSRLSPGWQYKLEAGDIRYLDVALSRSVTASARSACTFSREDEEALATRAGEDVRQLEKARRQALAEFEGRPDWKVVFLAEGKEPLWPQGFDPWNVQRLERGLVLHRRMFKAGNKAGSIEVMDQPSLSEPAGAHPLFNGLRRLTVSVPAEPTVKAADGTVSLDAEGLRARLQGVRVERNPQTRTLRVHLP